MNGHNQQTFDLEHRNNLMQDAERQRLAGEVKDRGNRNRFEKVIAGVGSQMVAVGKQLEEQYGYNEQTVQRRAYSR